MLQIFEVTNRITFPVNNFTLGIGYLLPDLTDQPDILITETGKGKIPEFT
jgi:hypothetical protein